MLQRITARNFEEPHEISPVPGENGLFQPRPEISFEVLNVPPEQQDPLYQLLLIHVRLGRLSVGLPHVFMVFENSWFLASNPAKSAMIPLNHYRGTTYTAHAEGAVAPDITAVGSTMITCERNPFQPLSFVALRNSLNIVKVFYLAELKPILFADPPHSL